MIKYYVYNKESENFHKVNRDVFYSNMRFYKTNCIGFTQENIWRYVNGDLIKEKRLIGNSVNLLSNE